MHPLYQNHPVIRAKLLSRHRLKSHFPVRKVVFRAGEPTCLYFVQHKSAFFLGATKLHCFHVLGNQPPASFGLIARQFLYVMSRIQSPLCTYCRRWPCSDHLDSCRLCRCCFQISQFGRDQSLTKQRYLDLVARLTVILGELAAHSSWPWELGRSTESQSRPQDHRRVRSSSRSSSDHSPLRRRIGCQIAREERHEETREARSSPTPKPRSSRGQETWTPTLRHRRAPSPNRPVHSAQSALELRPAPRPPHKQEGDQAAPHYNTPPPPPPPPKWSTENNQVARGARQ